MKSLLGPLALGLLWSGSVFAAKPSPAEDWSSRSSLPLLSVARKSDPAGMFRAPTLPAAGPSFATDAEAEKAARLFLQSHFGTMPAMLELEKAAKIPGGYLVVFSGRFHGIQVQGAGADVAFVGKTASAARQQISRFQVKPDSERKVIGRAAAAKKIEQLVLAETGKPLPANWKKDSSRLRLVYVFSTENLRQRAARTEDLYVPQWNFDRDSLALDAFTGEPLQKG